jgi:hypothetical protein
MSSPKERSGNSEAKPERAINRESAPEITLMALICKGMIQYIKNSLSTILQG